MNYRSGWQIFTVIKKKNKDISLVDHVGEINWMKIIIC